MILGNEETREIEGLEDYRVSTSGRVWSFKSGKEWREMKMRPAGNGAKRVNVCTATGVRTVYVGGIVLDKIRES